MGSYLKEYDETDPISIETYTKKLIGKTFADVCREDDITKSTVVREASNYEVKHANKKRKGGEEGISGSGKDFAFRKKYAV